MQKAFDGELELVGSDILEIKMLKIRNDEKRSNVQGGLTCACQRFDSSNFRTNAEIRPDKEYVEYPKL